MRNGKHSKKEGDEINGKKRVRFYELVLEKNEQINLFENEGITLEDKEETWG